MFNKTSFVISISFAGLEWILFFLLLLTGLFNTPALIWAILWTIWSIVLMFILKWITIDKIKNIFKR